MEALTVECVRHDVVLELLSSSVPFWLMMLPWQFGSIKPAGYVPVDGTGGSVALQRICSRLRRPVRQFWISLPSSGETRNAIEHSLDPGGGWGNVDSQVTP